MKSLIILAISVVSFFSMNTINAQNENQEKLQSSYVCYVNDAYMGKEQIPVDVKGKVYYGCCQGCVEKLQKNRDLRYSIDPYSQNEVDKATAYIVLKEKGKSEVLYFENKENYEKYILK